MKTANVLSLKMIKSLIKKRTKKRSKEMGGRNPSLLLMQIIIKKHKYSDEIVPATESESNVRDEVNRRTFEAGYTDRDGQPRKRRDTGAGKGDTPRPCNMKKYRENYVKIFGNK